MKDKEKTTVIFRRFKCGQIVAIFPYEAWDRNGLYCTSYMHEGQHGAAGYNLNGCTTLAKPDEFADLKRELESIGYNLEVKSRVNYAKVRAVVAAQA